MCVHPFEKTSEPGLYKVSDAVTEEHIITMAQSLIRKKFTREFCLTAPELTRQYLSLQMATLDHEVFFILFLDSRNCILAFEDLFHGTIDGASVYPREVVKKALHYNAASVIFAHNHPSGVADPSSADQRLTQRLIKALETVDIRVLDHMVVGATEIVSFAERGLL